MSRSDADVGARLRLLVEEGDEYAIFLLDELGRVETWNAGAEELTGYPAAEVVGRGFSALYTPQDIADEVPGSTLAAAISDGQHRGRGRWARPDGTLYWVTVTITEIIGPESTLDRRADTGERLASEGRVERQLDLLRERERIARGLHETVVHRIVEIGLILEGALSYTHEEPVATRIQTAVELLDDTVRHIRIVVLGLPGEIDQL